MSVLPAPWWPYDTPEEPKMTDLVKRLRFQIAQLRHAYSLLQTDRLAQPKEFANGLISPAIAEFEVAADEIERLREENDKLTRVMGGDMGIALIQKSLIEDMREYLPKHPPFRWLMLDNPITAFLDAYAKDRGIE